MSRYASATTVSSTNSVLEIEQTVTRYGADAFSYAWRDHEDGTGQGKVEFLFRGRSVRIEVSLPPRSDFEKTETGRDRAPAAVAKAYEQAKRQRWRALALVVKAKLEAVDSGIRTFEQEFGMDLLLPDGRTVADTVLPQLAAGAPLLLTSGEGAS